MCGPMVKTLEPRIVPTWNMRKLYLQILNHARSLARCNLTDHEHNSVYQREPRGPTIAPASRSDSRLLASDWQTSDRLITFWLSRFAPLVCCESLFGTLILVIRRNSPDRTAGTSTTIAHVSYREVGLVKDLSTGKRGFQGRICLD